MDINALRTFLAAADTGSFSGAAQRVHASPSSVTERIKQLERLIGARLFDRDKRGCRLTPAGRKFLTPATQAIRALDIARHDVGLPERYTASLSFGGQYALWDRRLSQWLADVRHSHPHIAWRATAGASARLNRDLAEGFLDLAVLYDPVFRLDIGSEPLFEDQLILVTAGDPVNWEKDYIRIEWGRDIGVEIASRLGLATETGLVLDLGGRSLDWMLTHHMAGYVPMRSAIPHLADGKLKTIESAPKFDFPVYACWRRDVDPELAAQMVMSLKNANLNSEIQNL